MEQGGNNMHTSKLFKRKAPEYFQYFFMALLAVVFLSPFIVMISTSFKTMQEAFDPNGSILPRNITFANYPAAINKIPYFRYMYNTAFITFWCLIGQLMVTPMIAYSLSKIKWVGSKIIFSLVMATMMIPYTVTMIPLYRIWKMMGMTGTYLPLIIPMFFGNAFYIIIMRQFFMGLPDSLMEAARIDGCNDYQTYFKIALPLVKPALSTIAIFTFLSAWSDYLAPMIYISKQSKYTLSLGLQAFLNEFTVDWTMLMAAAAIFVAPVILVFLMMQRYFVEGISTTGLK